MRGKKAQESGSLQSLLIALLTISTIAILSVSYINSIGDNYDVAVNDSQYEVFASFDDINETLTEFTGVFLDESGEQIVENDIISNILSAGYGLIKIIFQLPGLFRDLILAGTYSLGLPVIVARFLEALVWVIILFAALALVMKVRA